MPERPLIEADFTRRRALMLPETARYDVLLGIPKDGSLGAAVTAAMEAVESHFPPLAGQLPKDYQRFEDDVLEEMMRTFDAEALRTASGDVFGRIYEYFLTRFSKEKAHDNGEFFTPPSRFPDARLRDVEGLVKLVERGEVEAHDWSLTPGRYVGVAPEEEDENFDFAETMRSIHADLKELNEEAAELAARIARNFEGLGV